jgi:hypothetical protein
VGADLARLWLNPDVKMQDLFAHPKLPVERDGRVVAIVSLNIDDPGTALRGDLAQMLDQGSRYVPSPMRCADRKVVNVTRTMDKG